MSFRSKVFYGPPGLLFAEDPDDTLTVPGRHSKHGTAIKKFFNNPALHNAILCISMGTCIENTLQDKKARLAFYIIGGVVVVPALYVPRLCNNRSLPTGSVAMLQVVTSHSKQPIEWLIRSLRGEMSRLHHSMT